MAEFTEYAPGTFSWVDLGTSDSAGAKKFYGELFGWEMVDMPAGEDMIYTMCQINGKQVAALYQMGAPMLEQGMPPFWNSYVSVANADETAAKVTELGGTVMMGPMDVMDAGRMAMIQDPTGAVVAAWQPGEHAGAEIANEPNTFSWTELVTNDTAKAKEFYAGLFGWNAQTQNMGKFDYTTFLVGERMNAGMMPIQAEWGDVPPHWAVYFAVENCDAMVEKAKSLGGNVLMPAQDIPNIGRFSLLQDPQGATFYVIKFAQ